MSTLLYFHDTDIFPYHPINLIWMIILVPLSFSFFTIINQSTTDTSESQPSNDKRNSWLKHNTLLSCIHSFLSSILIIIAVVRAPEMFDDPLSHINFFNYATIAFSVGYFFWDFFDCWHNSTSSTLVILIHHTIVITFFSHTLIYTRNLGYGIFALSLEINSVFLHARRLLRWYSSKLSSLCSKELLKSLIDIGNYVTFILFRFGIVIYGLQQLYIQSHRLDPIIHLFTTSCVASIGILNIVLFYRLLINQIKRQSKKKHDDKVVEDHILTINNRVILPS